MDVDMGVAEVALRCPNASARRGYRRLQPSAAGTPLQLADSVAGLRIPIDGVVRLGR